MSSLQTLEVQRDDPALGAAELIERYAAAPTILERTVRGMTREQMLARPIEGKWSSQEALCHISDAEQVFADRIKRTLSMSRPLLMGIEPNDYAMSLKYHDRVPTEELAIVELTRSHISRILSRLSEEAWRRTAVHSETGIVTVRQLVLHAVRHLEHHLQAIHEKRMALGLEP